MSKLRLNKSELRRLDQNLLTYRRYLPALELRRQQLIGMRASWREEYDQHQRAGERLERQIGQQLPMLADLKLPLHRLVRVRELSLDWENVAGIRLPRLARVDFETQPLDRLFSPVWLDSALILAREYTQWLLRKHLLEERRRFLEQAIAKTTQRVNLFEQVLIPDAEQDRRRIQLFLSDEATSAVVRAKIAKRKVQAEPQREVPLMILDEEAQP